MHTKSSQTLISDPAEANTKEKGSCRLAGKPRTCEVIRTLMRQRPSMSRPSESKSVWLVRRRRHSYRVYYTYRRTYLMHIITRRSSIRVVAGLVVLISSRVTAGGSVTILCSAASGQIERKKKETKCYVGDLTCHFWKKKGKRTMVSLADDGSRIRGSVGLGYLREVECRSAVVQEACRQEDSTTARQMPSFSTPVCAARDLLSGCSMGSRSVPPYPRRVYIHKYV